MKDFIERLRKLIGDAAYCQISLPPDDTRKLLEILDIAESEIRRPSVGKVEPDYSEELTEVLKAIGAKKAIIEVGKNVKSINIYGTLGEDQTKKYAGMIHVLECDFNLAMDPDSRYGLDDLQVAIDRRTGRIIDDVRLLQELSYEIRHGLVRIIKLPS